MLGASPVGSETMAAAALRLPVGRTDSLRDSDGVRVTVPGRRPRPRRRGTYCTDTVSGPGARRACHWSLARHGPGCQCRAAGASAAPGPRAHLAATRPGRALALTPQPGPTRLQVRHPEAHWQSPSVMAEFRRLRSTDLELVSPMS